MAVDIARDQLAIERRIYCNRQRFLSVRDKPTRSRAFQARCAMGKVYLLRNAPSLSDLFAELLSFPAGRHDDICDSLGMLDGFSMKWSGAAFRGSKRKLTAAFSSAHKLLIEWR